MLLSHHISERLDQIASFVTRDDALEVIKAGELRSKARALALRAIIATPGLPDFLYNTRIRKPYADHGLPVIGVGVHAVAVKSGTSEVKKLYPRTVTMDQRQKNDYISALDDKQKIACKYLGQFVVPQEFSIQTNPLDDSTSVVIAIQPFIKPHASIKLGTATVSEELNDFAARSLCMQDEGHALPDIVGNRNLLVGENGIQLIDPIALLADDPSDSYAYEKANYALSKYLKNRVASS